MHDRPLTIGVVCHFPPPPGGMPGQALALVQSLEREGLRAIPIATNLGGGAIRRRLDATRFLRTFIRWPVFLGRLARHIGALDVIHVHTCSGLYFFLFAGPSLLLGRWLGRRTVLHYHSGAAASFFDEWPRAVRWIVAHADRVIVPSRFLKQIFEERGWRVSVVPNICELDRFAFTPKPAAPRLIVARHLERTYNVECVLRAFALVQAQMPDATLFVLGGGPEEARLKALTQRLGLGGVVTFTGYVDNADMPRFFEQASIFVNASNTDNMPISILEAFAAGLPVVSTKAGGIPLLVDHGRTGLLVDLDDHEAMADAVLTLLRQPELAARLTSAARQVAEQYSWDRIFPELLAEYGSDMSAASIDLKRVFSSPE